MYYYYCCCSVPSPGSLHESREAREGHSNGCGRLVHHEMMPTPTCTVLSFPSPFVSFYVEDSYSCSFRLSLFRYFFLPIHNEIAMHTYKARMSLLQSFRFAWYCRLICSKALSPRSRILSWAPTGSRAKEVSHGNHLDRSAVAAIVTVVVVVFVVFLTFPCNFH